MKKILMLDGLTMTLSLTEDNGETACFSLHGEVIIAKWCSNMWMQV